MHLSGGHGLGDKALEGELLLLEVLSRAVSDLESSHGIAELGLNLLLLASLQLEGKCLVGNNLLDTANVGLKLLLGLEALAESLVVALESLSVADHLLNLTSGELANRVGDGDVGATTRGLLGGSNLEDTVDIDLENTLENSLTSAHRRDRSKGEFTQRGVVVAVDTLTLEDGELDSLLVIGNSGEGTLAQARNSATAGNNGSKDVALHGNTEGERADIEEEEVSGLLRAGLAGKDSSLDGSTVGNSLIGVNALLELLAVEELRQKLLDARDTGGTTDQDDFVNLGLVDGGVLEDLGDRLKSARESLGVEVLETGTGDGHGEVLTIKERVNLNGGLSTAGQGTLGTLASSAETAESTSIAADVLLGLASEVLAGVL